MKMPLTQLARRGTVALVVTAGLIVVGASTLRDASAAPQRSKRSTSLTLTRRNPVTVSGHGFRPRAHVRVRLIATRTLFRTPRANRAGAFFVTFPMVIDRCSSWSISAAQPYSPTAVLRGPGKPECAPASTP